MKTNSITPSVYHWLASAALATLPVVLLAACAAAPQGSVAVLSDPSAAGSAAAGRVAASVMENTGKSKAAASVDAELNASGTANEASDAAADPAMLPLSVAADGGSESTPGDQTDEVLVGGNSRMSVADDKVVEVDGSEAGVSDPEDGELLQLALASPASIFTPPPSTVMFQFALNSDMPAESDVQHLQEHGAYLANHPGMKLTVNGYSDSQGAAEYNYVLSERRAKKIADLLMGFGASPEQIEIYAYGEASAAGKVHADDRRVELEYMDPVTLTAR